MKGLIISALGKGSFSQEQLQLINDSMDAEFISRIDTMSKEEFIRLADFADIVGVTRRPIKEIDCEIIENLPNLKGMAIYSTGYEWVDFECMKQRGVILSYIPDYCTVSVAEHSLGLILTLSRRIHLSYDKVRSIVPPNVSLRGFEIRNKNIGIIGMGRIGNEIASLLKAFKVNVRYFDKVKKDNEYEYMPFKELLGSSDIIVLACLKVRGEKSVISNKEFSIMKRGTTLVNAARADLVDNSALLLAIKKGIIAGYAVDDDVEELKINDFDYGRIIMTGHTAWYSSEAMERGTWQWVKNIVALAKNQPENVVGGYNNG